MAGGEYVRYPPRVVRGLAVHAAIAPSATLTV